MTVIGALLLAFSVASVVVALRAPSRVERLLRRPLGGEVARSARAALVVPVDTLAAAGLPRDGDALAIAKIASCGGGALAGCLLALVLGAGPLPIALCAYGGFIAPTLAVERRAASRRRGAERAVVILVERLHALAAAGRPVESAVVLLAERGSGSGLVDEILDAARRDYVLGAPLHEALARHARTLGVERLVDLAERVDRSRALGRGAVTMLVDLRDDLREEERRRLLEHASGVEGRLTLVLTLCYLPALALLVVVPLFLTLLSALSG